MKRTEKEIYNFVKKKLEEAIDEINYLISIHPHFDEKRQNECMVKIKAYKEVLNFIGTVRADEKRLNKNESMDLRLKAFQNAQAALEEYDKKKKSKKE